MILCFGQGTKSVWTVVQHIRPAGTDNKLPKKYVMR